MTAWLRAGVLAAVLLVPLGVGHTQPGSDTLAYRARKGDTLSLIADEFYGDRTKAIFIMVANKITHARPLKAGERLRIPVSRQITTAPGDTFRTLATTLLGDERRGPFLAEFNGMRAEDRLASGTALSIPFTVTHTAQATESIASIAAAYFGDSRNAAMLRAYNFLDRDAIDKGTPLIVPVVNVRLQAAKMPALDAESRARRERQQLAQGRAAQALPAARQAMRAGEFGAVRAALAEVELDIDYLVVDQAVEVGILLGSLHLAAGDTRPALEWFKRVRERAPDHRLSPYQHAPKIVALWKDAGGSVEGEP